MAGREPQDQVAGVADQPAGDDGDRSRGQIGQGRTDIGLGKAGTVTSWTAVHHHSGQPARAQIDPLFGC